MGGAQPLAVTMNGGVALVVEVDPARIEKRLSTRYLDESTDDVDLAIEKARAYALDGVARSIGVLGNAAEVMPAFVARGFTPDVITDQTSAHDPLVGYIPDGLSLAEAARLRTADPDEYQRRSIDAMGRHVAAMRELQKRGAIAFDYGNNIRAQAVKAGVGDAFEIPGFVPEYIRPLFCEGKGPFRWVALSGDPEDIRVTDRAALEMFPDDDALCRWIRLAGERVQFQGLPARICWLGYGDRARFGLKLNQLVRDGAVQGADRDRPRSSRHRIGGVAESRNRRHARRQRRDRRLADPQRAAQRLGGRDLGVGAPRRRRRHRLFDSRGNGDRRGRDARRRRAAGARADVRSGHGRGAARRCRVSRSAQHRTSTRSTHPHAGDEPMMAPHAGLERRVLAALDATPARIPVVIGGCGTGRTTMLHALADRMGRDQCQYVDVERAASTPERFHEAVAAASPFTINGQRAAAPQEPASSARAAFDRTLALVTRARAKADAPATFLLDEILELRTFESFPGLRHVLREMLHAHGRKRQPLRAHHPLRVADASPAARRRMRASK